MYDRHMKIWKIILITLSMLFFTIGIIMSYIPADQFVETGSIIAVVMISLPAFYSMWKIYGGRGIATIIVLGIFALGIETIGIHTGFPYSRFEYIMPFGYRLLGSTPWTVFIAWSPLVIGVFLLTKKYTHSYWKQWFIYISLLLGLDSVLDPGAVARGLWKYTDGGIWFDVPVQNFFGWIVSGTIAYMILRFILKNKNLVIASDSAAILENSSVEIASYLAKTDHQTKYLQIGLSSLLLSVFLWSGVNIGYGLWIPAIIGWVLGFAVLIEILEIKTSH